MNWFQKLTVWFFIFVVYTASIIVLPSNYTHRGDQRKDTIYSSFQLYNNLTASSDRVVKKKSSTANNLLNHEFNHSIGFDGIVLGIPSVFENLSFLEHSFSNTIDHLTTVRLHYIIFPFHLFW
ncbi:MAG: hypothetical protein J5I52_11510 [Saprospiraceae bacterium]|nr:MAG: hypothetical protein UZ09_BCD002001411 [Bacteroidetes bacterium OLB9]MCO6464763.1 hypothetical protein [Saprospiraceae bacterium]